MLPLLPPLLLPTVDTTPPNLTVPVSTQTAPFIIEAAGNLTSINSNNVVVGALILAGVKGKLFASDIVDGSVEPECKFANGAAVTSTSAVTPLNVAASITCSAKDTAGNTQTSTFTVMGGAWHCVHQLAV
jgi:hypothetical protein